MLLPDCTLFPHGGLPLHIFEEQYRKMLANALAGECVFAISRVREDENGEAEDIAGVGTVGLVRASREAPDGTSQLLLHGVTRVKFQKWIEDKDYPCALIEPISCIPLPEEQREAAAKMLKAAVEDVISGLEQEVRDAVMLMLDQSDDPALLSDLIAQQFVQNPDLRQELLETLEVGTRVQLLCEYFHKLGQLS